jgi:NAD(P)-dependent dehydrogenase (short-subunit alcohol dehydrogenase family)
MPETGLNDKIAIVTGSGRGLGRAMALGLLSAGASVAINDINEDAIANTVRDAEQAGHESRVFGFRADVSVAEQAADLVDSVVDHFGALHVVVNNAGVGPEIVRPDFMTNPVKLWEIPVEVFRRGLEINTFGPFFMIRAAVPRLIAGGWGRIINITTSLDTMIRPGYSPYGGSKAATEAFTAILAGDLEGTGVSANVLIPGGAANTRLIPDDAPIDRNLLVQPEQMVPPLRWLSSEASDGITGRRFIARFWRTDLPAAEAAEEASSAAAWPGIERVVDRPPV